jgi:pimeloyl-ACP methyl ester carboxylesterase
MLQRLDTALMRLMFRPVFGWRDATPLPKELVALAMNSADGSALEAFTARAAVRRRGIVVLCHPFLKYGWRWFLRQELPQALTAAGYDVVAFNYKGFGGSELRGGRFPDDVAGVVRRVAAGAGGDPVFVYGASFGGFHAVHAVADELDGLVAGLVLDSVPLAVERFFQSGAVASLMRGLSRSRWRHATATAPIGEPLAAIKQTPVLALLGEADPLLTQADRAQLAAHARVVSFPGCKHLEALKQSRTALYEAVVGFFQEASRGRS